MTTLIAAIALQATGYAFPTEPILCELNVNFKGFLPILRGAEGSSQVKLVVSVQALGAGESGRLKLSHELVEFRVTLNEALLPFNKQNVIPFLPRTTIETSPLGVVTKTDAPDKDLPVTLPGLDIRRFPEVSYLPVQLPTEPFVTGLKWDFERSYGGFPMKYRAEVAAIENKIATIKVVVTQKFTQDLNEFRIPVSKSQKTAGLKPTFTSDCTTIGGGTVTFDLNRGVATSSSIKLSSVTEFRGIVIDQAGEDKLETELRMSLK